MTDRMLSAEKVLQWAERESSLLPREDSRDLTGSGARMILARLVSSIAFGQLDADCPDGAAVTSDGMRYMNPEHMRHDAESYEACMMAMDDAGVPRRDDSGKALSIWGRACRMARQQTLEECPKCGDSGVPYDMEKRCDCPAGNQEGEK